MAEYIIELNEALYNEETGEACFNPTIKGEIVRCKDCIHRMTIDDGDAVCEFDATDPYARTRYADEDDWFCKDGERRDGRIN